MSYTREQKQLIAYSRQKVESAFTKRPSRAHGIDHVGRVAAWAREIAGAEKARSVFICELAAWFHDIGRAFEEKLDANNRGHAEISYRVLSNWFRDDRHFDILTRAQKLELLYSVRYHWNDEANKYDTAWILRDADKLDCYGVVGVKRLRSAFDYGTEEWNLVMRCMFANSLRMRSKTACKIIKNRKLLLPLEKELKKFLKGKIEKVEL